MEFFEGRILAFVLVLTRVSAFLISAPIFSWIAIPIRVKIAIAFLTSIFFAMITPAIASVDSMISIILLIANEVIYGIALGIATTMLYSVVKMSGRIAERQMGMAMAATLDPLSGERSQPLSILLEMIFILLFLSANGHHLLLMIISRSYESFPPGVVPTIPILLEGIVSAGTTMLLISLRLAAPMLAAFLLLLVVLAVFARIMPDMNILFISMPLRVGMGLLMMGIFIPFINQFVGEFAEWMGKLLPI